MLSKKVVLVSLAVLSLFFSCNKETYIESVGYVMLEAGDGSDVGYYIFTSVDASSNCAPIEIYINDKLVGKITDDYTISQPKCDVEPIEGKLLKVVAEAGSHTIMAKYTKCGQDGQASYTLKRGNCMLYTLSFKP